MGDTSCVCLCVCVCVCVCVHFRDIAHVKLEAPLCPAVRFFSPSFNLSAEPGQSITDNGHCNWKFGSVCGALSGAKCSACRVFTYHMTRELLDVQPQSWLEAGGSIFSGHANTISSRTESDLGVKGQGHCGLLVLWMKHLEGLNCTGLWNCRRAVIGGWIKALLTRVHATAKVQFSEAAPKSQKKKTPHCFPQTSWIILGEIGENVQQAVSRPPTEEESAH